MRAVGLAAREPERMEWPCRFALHRWYDLTGQSGAGIVVDGMDTVPGGQRRPGSSTEFLARRCGLDTGLDRGRGPRG